ncbi:MAG: DUF484 family protein [Nevskiaceae bacterium]|nr:MAG: DUF484 family protein [Nevskiaceae bacterium]TBR73090.1 MAG: DUF484 family protein [Nevskiaceae bacterium]
MPKSNQDIIEDLGSEEDRAVGYVRRHPNFLTRHPELLENLQLNHASGPAVSLIERQVQVLRGKNARLEERMTRMLDNARDNERRSTAVQRLARGLIRAPSLAAIAATLRQSMNEDFAVDEVFIGLLAPGFRRHDIEGITPLDATHPVLACYANFFRTRLTECGTLDTERGALLFPHATQPVHSAAVVPLERDKTIGMIALGAADSERFRPRQGKLFLEMVADLAGAALRAHL